MSSRSVNVFFLCECAACRKHWAVLTEPRTGCQLWYDQRFYPTNPESTVSGQGYCCPLCGAPLSGWPGMMTADGDWVRVTTDGVLAVLN
jgi:hypothetical protein